MYGREDQSEAVSVRQTLERITEGHEQVAEGCVAEPGGRVNGYGIELVTENIKDMSMRSNFWVSTRPNVGGMMLGT